MSKPRWLRWLESAIMVPPELGVVTVPTDPDPELEAMTEKALASIAANAAEHEAKSAEILAKMEAAADEAQARYAAERQAEQERVARIREEALARQQAWMDDVEASLRGDRSD